MSQTQQQTATAQTNADLAALEDVLAGYRAHDHGDSDYLEEVTRIVETEIGIKYLRDMRPEFARANVLSNRSDAEVHEAVTLVRFRTNQFIEEHPPAGSKMVGGLRELVYGNDNEPLSDGEVRELEALEQVLIARILQSRNMEQQRIIKEMRQDSHVTREDSGGGGLGDRLRNAFR